MDDHIPPPPVLQPQRSRSSVGWLVGILAAVALVVVGVAVVSGDDEDDGGPPPSAPPGLGAPAGGGRSGEDGDGGEVASPAAVRVVESGFSTYDDGGTTRLGYAVILENTSDRPVHGVHLDVRFRDAGGAVLDTASENIAVLLPGQEFGVGGSGLAVVETAELDVAVELGTDPPDPDDVSEITVDDVRVSVTEWNDLLVDFTATSGYGERLEGPEAYLVFRDAEGELVGGFVEFLLGPLAPGDATPVQVEVREPLTQVASAEVFIDPSTLPS